MLPMPTLAPGGATTSMAQLLLSDNTLACVLWVDFSNGALDFDGVRAGTTKLPWARSRPSSPKGRRQARDPPTRRRPPWFLIAERGAAASAPPSTSSVNSRARGRPRRARTRTRSPSPPTPGSTGGVATGGAGPGATLVGNVCRSRSTRLADCGALCPMPFPTRRSRSSRRRSPPPSAPTPRRPAPKGESPAAEAPSGW